MEGGYFIVHKAIRLAWVMVVIVLLSSIGSLDALLSMGITCMHHLLHVSQMAWIKDTRTFGLHYV